MTNIEYKLQKIESRLDFILYCLGYMDLGDIPKEDAQMFNMMYERSLRNISREKARLDASNKRYQLLNELNQIEQDWPELKKEDEFIKNDK